MRGLLVTLLCVLAVATLSGCATTHSHAKQSATSTISPAATATRANHTGLPFDCPNPDRPVFAPGASIAIHPDKGPVGTMVTVAITGLQPGCHLFLDLQVAPSLSEISGTPWPAPMQARSGIKWIQVSSTGTVETTFCVCRIIDTYALGYPPYPTEIPVLGPNTTNVGDYAPKFGDYFWVTVATPDLAKPTVFAKFTVTP
ncbi:MAG: hypothetical protein ACRDHE_00015 [Ktedonobacterales bacterium]